MFNTDRWSVKNSVKKSAAKDSPAYCSKLRVTWKVYIQKKGKFKKLLISFIASILYYIINII